MALLIGAALRMHHLGAKSIWWDEAHSWWYAHMPLVEGVSQGMAAWHGAAGDPLFTVVLHLWISLVGDSAFAMRFLSTLVDLITVAYLGRVAGRAFVWRTGIVALVIGAIAPIWIFYSQEVRQYALTPGIMLIMIEAAVRIYQAKMQPPLSAWFQLAIGEALALYTHSFMVFAVTGINLWLAWLWLRDARFDVKWLRSWTLTQIGVLILIVPALPNYLRRLEAGHNPFVQSLSVPHILNAQLSLFMGLPWENATNLIPLRFFVDAALVLLVVGLVIVLRRQKPRLLADLGWWIIVTQALTVIYWTRNPILHPRYMLFLTGPLLIIFSFLLVRTWESSSGERIFSATLAAVLILLSVFSVNNLYEGKMLGYQHDPARAMTGLVRTSFGPKDGIITIDPNDYTLLYYGIGQAPLFRAGLDDGDHTPADLVNFIKGKDRIGVVRFHAERSDTREIIPFYLERFGKLVNVQTMPSYTISTYQLDASANQKTVSFQPISYNWGLLSLNGYSVQSSDAVTVALHWIASSNFNTDSRYASIVRLIDPETDWLLGSASSQLLSDQAAPTSEWSPNQEATQYYVIPLLPGTPPLTVDLEISLVDSTAAKPIDLLDANGAPAGQQATLGSIQLGIASDEWHYANDQRPFRITEVNSDLIAGFATDWPTTAPGGSVALTIQWKVPLIHTSGTMPLILVSQNGKILASDNGLPLQGRLPNFTTNSSWFDRRVLPISADAEPGPADIIIAADDKKFVLGQVQVIGFQRITERPEIANPFKAQFGTIVVLLGYKLDAPEHITSQSTLDLTLYWQAHIDGSPGKDYVVTVQILDQNGRLIGQNDSVPVNGTRPTSGWLEGEYVVDLHPITFRETYSGPATIQVALYDPVTFERLKTSEGLDAVILPIHFQVESGE